MKRVALGALALVAACSSSAGPEDAGPFLGVQRYYALAPGQCFEYADADGGPALGLTVTSEPAGVALELSRHGQQTRVDHLIFDGGLALLAQQDFVAGTSLRSRIFTPPLAYVQAPLAANQPALTSSGAYQDDVGGSAAGTGQETWETDVLSAQPFGGYPAAFELQFSVSDSQVDAGESFATERRWVAPAAGFVDIYTQNDTGQFVDFALVDVHAAAAGCAVH